MTETVVIDAMGAQGDGIAENGGFIPFTLPGETVSIERHGKEVILTDVLKASESRRQPPCPHFGPAGDLCGGCATQHADDGFYRRWKRQLVVDALVSRGIKTETAELHICEPGARRRIVLTARKTGEGPVLGFNQAGSHTVFALQRCLVATDGLNRKLGDLRALLQHIPGKSLRMTALETETGLDVAISGGPALRPPQRQAAVAEALKRDIARLSCNDEILIEPRKPVLQFGKASVTPPPGGFVQAVLQAEKTMTNLVLAHLKKTKRVADLFSGCGTFALALAGQSAVHAVESDGPSLAALDRAARHTPGLKPVTSEKRDLYRRPLTRNELKTFDGVTFDPPRAGAEQQCLEIAASTVRRVAAISCNPVTLARDLEILTTAGFEVTSVTPIDQFLWSPHVEVVALLERK
nr:class I SAM-dependent RNA methyltransferase [Flavimaribacter sediminis]